MKKIIKFINKIIRHTKWYNEEFWQGVSKFWYNNKFNIDVVNLGSGASVYAFNYKHLPIIGANWALSPQSLVHDYRILQNYFSYLREGAFVLITVCPFSCLFSSYNKQHNFKYYTILHPATIDGFDDEERTKALQIKSNPFITMPLLCIKKTIKEILHIPLRRIKKKPAKNLNLSAKKMMESWKEQFGISDINVKLSEKHLAEQQSRKKTLEDMISFCKERSLKPIIVIPPMHRSLTELFSDEFLQNYVWNFLEGLDVVICDYSRSSLCIEDEYFKHPLFMSEKGATEFTKTILNDLNILSL